MLASSSGVMISSLSMLSIQSFLARAAARFFMLPKPSNGWWWRVTLGYWAAMVRVLSVESLSSKSTSLKLARALRASARQRSAFLTSMVTVMGVFMAFSL